MRCDFCEREPVHRFVAVDHMALPIGAQVAWLVCALHCVRVPLQRLYKKSEIDPKVSRRSVR